MFRRAPHPNLKTAGSFGLELPEIPKEVFISYARRDEALAMEVEKRLEGFGFTVFRDRNELDAGQNFPDRLRSAVAEAGAVVALLTPRAVTREWVLLECRLAQEANKLLACSAGAIPAKALPANLQDLHLTDLSRIMDPTDVAIYELARALGRKLGRPAVEQRAAFMLKRIRQEESDKKHLRSLKDEWRTLQRKPINPLAVGKFHENQTRGTPLEAEVSSWIAREGAELLSAAKVELAASMRDPARAEEAQRCSALAATMGYTPALVFLGLGMYNGWFGERRPTDARVCWEQGAIRGNVDAYKYFASSLRDGDGGPVDVLAAADWNRLAAGAGDAQCMTEYGNLALKGLHAPDGKPNDTLARYWFTKAALRGNTVAKVNLGQLLANRTATPEDLDRGITLLTEVAETYKGDEQEESLQAFSPLRAMLERGWGSAAVRARAERVIAKH